MPVTFNEKLIAYLTLFSGLFISAIAEYYSIVGFTAIFSAAVIPVIIMGVALGLGKITATLWLKQNWNIASWSLRIYLLSAIVVLMAVTSLGIFGFLSKAHSDQTLVSGDVLSQIAIYDDKISTEKENIDVARKALKQLDEAVDQVMGRSSDERGADKAAQIRRSQQRERAALQRDIVNAQSNIAKLQSERAPIAAEVRKVEAEVGPLKYIATFIYGEADKTLLEKAVTWVIILLIVVFDPLAVILLLSSQISFQAFRDRETWNFERDLEDAADAFNDVFADELDNTDKTPEELMGIKPDPWVADVGEKPTAEELAQIATEGDSPEKESDVVSTATVTEHHPDTHPYLREGFKYPPGWMFQPPMVANPPRVEPVEPIVKSEIESIDWNSLPSDGYVTINGERMNAKAAKDMYGPKHLVSNYIQNEEQTQSGQWNKVISEQEYREKLEKQKHESNNNTNNSA